MADPRETSEILGAPLDASAATGTGEFVAQAPPGDLPQVLMQPAPAAPVKTFASFSFNLGPPGFFDNDLTWIDGCTGLGFQPLKHVKSNTPPLAEMTGFMAQSPNWILFSGHFYALGEMSVLCPVLTNEVIPEGTHTVNFFRQECAVKAGSDGVVLKRGVEFAMHLNAEVLFWAGCHALKNVETIGYLRSLFGTQSLLLGFVDLTGYEVTKLIFGGEVPYRDAEGNATGKTVRHPNSFFARLKGQEGNLVAVRDAWLDAAHEYYAGADLCSRFSAVDPDGTWWQLNRDGTRRTRTE